MEKYDYNVSTFEDRVAEMSIHCVKKKDQKHGKTGRTRLYQKNYASRGDDRHFVAHSTLKASSAGMNSSASALEFYSMQGMKKREEMLKKYSD